ncbi:MAG: hypothetical protein KDA49_00145, partial [Rhodospirillaceae bacterium]|nr:hypothetical protein [Rhodospirillaceae bacterium]
MTGRRRGIASGTQIPRPEDHGYPFDPTYGYGLAELLAVEPPTAPDDLAAFWGGHYDAATRIDPKPRVQRSAFRHPDWHALDFRDASTEDAPIGGWVELRRAHPMQRALLVGHG